MEQAAQEEEAGTGRIQNRKQPEEEVFAQELWILNQEMLLKGVSL